MLVKDMLQHCVQSDIDAAYKILSHLWSLGYAPQDIIGIIFRVAKTHDMPEFLKLEFIKVGHYLFHLLYDCVDLVLGDRISAHEDCGRG
jgi:replication factor C subunit 2/4